MNKMENPRHDETIHSKQNSKAHAPVSRKKEKKDEWTWSTGCTYKERRRWGVLRQAGGVVRVRKGKKEGRGMVKQVKRIAKLKNL